MNSGVPLLLMRSSVMLEEKTIDVSFRAKVSADLICRSAVYS
jgi:hypothetical protein